MEMYPVEIQACVTSPEIIRASDQRPNCELYYKRLTQQPGAPLWIKVIVCFAEEKLGEVITAFLTYDLVGGDILWMPPRLRLR